VRIDLGLPKPIVPLFWGMACLEATFGAYLGIWPLWIRQLGAPVAVVGFVLGASGFLRLGVLIPSAAIADRLGVRRAILLARAVAALGLLSAAFATHWTHLAFMVVGTTAGELAFPLIQLLVAAHAGDRRIRSFALVFTVGPSFALALAPLASGALVALFGMRAGFVLAAACTTASLVFLSRVEDPPAQPRPAAAPRSSYRAALGDPGVRLVAGLLLVAVFSLSLGTSFVPTFLEEVRGLEPAAIATLGAAAAVGSAAFGFGLARLHRLQRSPFVAVAAAVALTAVGFLIFRATAALPLLILAFFCRGGFFSTWATLAAALGDLAPIAHRARAFALGEMAGGLAYALGPIVAGPLYARHATLPFELATALALLLVPALLLAQRYAHRIREPATGDTATAVAAPVTGRD
jgi:MFS family permease